MPQGKLLSVEEIGKHNNPSDCWIVVDGQVWDFTEFHEDHPGGSAVILKYAGRDATKAYSEAHSPSVIKKNLPQDKFKGVLNQSTVNDEWLKESPTENARVVLDSGKPPLTTLINAYDFETVASKTVNRKTWAFYSSAATDLITRDANRSCFDRIWFRPRVMRNVRSVDTRTTIQGVDSSLPLFVSPAAMAKLIHPDGECAIARACESRGIMQGVSNNSSFSVEELVQAAPNASFFFQLYVNPDREKSAELLRQVSSLPQFKAIHITVDAAWPGKREADERVKADENVSVPMSDAKAKNDKKGGGFGRLMAGNIDPGLTWDDIAFVRKHTHLPVCLKGVMSADDAILAMEAGADGILLSNHGGRNLDTSPPSIITLLELQRRCPEVFDRMEVYVDSGIRRGTDILKAMALGATAVGMGRSMLFATNYGQEGVEHLIDIIREEFETAMRNNGITEVGEAAPEIVHTGDVDHLVPASRLHPYARKVTRRSQKSRVSKI
ncbi:putative mitochondrial cytochrome b2-like protein [Talaromyces proteolyticus]|uniref:L-lactate dehydrogenase (cytochrome) n=1 Tax=Talaromyces proteolyticus TaxID=1131652 RepID=A0AAD4KVT4_9EURO|nr:putative mitochondrial cytochrome b2-like protein [Talaromyces proteolyticus]KAH8697224.1 putative mitochondrial cytochrome b2-like protein [Talaromyces proteolyticus]